MDELQQLRSKIDKLDDTLIELLGERFKVTNEIGRYKLQHGIPIRDATREDAQAARLALLAKSNGLDPDFAERMLRHIIDEVVKKHEAMQKS